MTYARGARSCAVANAVHQTTIEATAPSLARALKRASFTNQFLAMTNSARLQINKHPTTTAGQTRIRQESWHYQAFSQPCAFYSPLLAAHLTILRYYANHPAETYPASSSSLTSSALLEDANHYPENGNHVLRDLFYACR